jgi:hypothetical protein
MDVANDERGISTSNSSTVSSVQVLSCLPSVNFDEDHFRLDLNDRVDAFHAPLFSQFGAVVEDGSARRENFYDNHGFGCRHRLRIARAAIHHDIRISNRIRPGLQGRVNRRGTTSLLFSCGDESRQNVAADDVVPFLGTGHGMGDAFNEFVALLTVGDGFEKFVAGIATARCVKPRGGSLSAEAAGYRSSWRYAARIFRAHPRRHRKVDRAPASSARRVRTGANIRHFSPGMFLLITSARHRIRRRAGYSGPR